MDPTIAAAFDRYRQERDADSFRFFVRRLSHWIRWSRRNIDRIPVDQSIARIVDRIMHPRR